MDERRCPTSSPRRAPSLLLLILLRLRTDRRSGRRSLGRLSRLALFLHVAHGDRGLPFAVAAGEVLIGLPIVLRVHVYTAAARLRHGASADDERGPAVRLRTRM